MGDDDTRHRMSVMVSAAAWGLGQWESMEEYVRSIPQNTMDGSFFQSLMHIHHRQFTSAQKVQDLFLNIVSFFNRAHSYNHVLVYYFR